jgi:hypothetical protein
MRAPPGGGAASSLSQALIAYTARKLEDRGVHSERVSDLYHHGEAVEIDVRFA